MSTQYNSPSFEPTTAAAPTISAAQYAGLISSIRDAGLLAIPALCTPRSNPGWSLGRWGRWQWRVNAHRQRSKALEPGSTTTWVEAADSIEASLDQHKGPRGQVYVFAAGSAHAQYGLLVIDIDQPNSPIVAATWAALSTLGVSPSTHIVETPKGLHYYYYVPLRSDLHPGANAVINDEAGERVIDMIFQGLVVGPGSKFFKPKYGRVVSYTRQPVNGQDLDFATWVDTIPLLSKTRDEITAGLAAAGLSGLNAGSSPQPKGVARAKVTVQDAAHPRTVHSDMVVATDNDGGLASLGTLIAGVQSHHTYGRGNRIPCPFCAGTHRENCRLYVDDGSNPHPRLYCFTTNSTTLITAPPTPVSDLPVLGQLTYYRKDQLIDGRYMPKHRLTRKVTLVRAHKGAGKTTWANTCIEELRDSLQYPQPQIVSITHRRTLARQLEMDLGLLNYQRVYSPTDRDIVVCFDSLTRCVSKHARGYILIMDEIAQLLAYCAQGGTRPDAQRHKTETRKGPANWAHFVEIVRNARIIIAMDADLDADTLAALQKLAPGQFTDENVEIIDVEDPRLFTDELQKDRHQIWMQVYQDLLAGHRVAVACSSVCEAEVLVAWLRGLGPNDPDFPLPRTPEVVNAIGPLHDMHPSPMESTMKCDVVVYTSTWGTGVDLSQKNGHWHAVYGIFDASVQTAADMSQMLGRVRYPTQTKRRLYIRNRVNASRLSTQDDHKQREEFIRKARARQWRATMPDMPYEQEHLSVYSIMEYRAVMRGRGGNALNAYASAYHPTPPVKWPKGLEVTPKLRWKAAKKLLSAATRTLTAARNARWQSHVFDAATPALSQTEAFYLASSAKQFRDDVEQALQVNWAQVHPSTALLLARAVEPWGVRRHRMASILRVSFCIAVRSGLLSQSVFDAASRHEAQQDATRLRRGGASRLAEAQIIADLFAPEGSYRKVAPGTTSIIVPQAHITACLAGPRGWRAGMNRWSPADFLARVANHGFVLRKVKGQKGVAPEDIDWSLSLPDEWPTAKPGGTPCSPPDFLKMPSLLQLARGFAYTLEN